MGYTIYVIGQSSSGAGNNLTTSFGTIDSDTGAYTQLVAALNGTSVAGATLQNLAYNRSNGLFYTTSNTASSADLRTLTTAGTLSSSLGTIGVTMGGMAINTSDSILYGYDRTNNNWDSISTSNGSPTVINANAGASFGAFIGGRLIYFNNTMFLISPRSTDSATPFGTISSAGSFSSIATNAIYKNMVLLVDNNNIYGLVPISTTLAALYKMDIFGNVLSLTNVTGTNIPIQFSGASFGAVPSVYNISPTWVTEVKNKARGGIPTCDNSSISSDFVAWNKLKTLLEKSQNTGISFSIGIVSTYSLVYSSTFIFNGGVLAPNGDIHFVPSSANRGQKVDKNGIVSTYSLVYTTSNAYIGGVLSSTGDIHFVPSSANTGQKINSSGIVSTYSLVYTTSSAYTGGVVAPNGDIHFVPASANRGQKISSAGVVSTYSLIYTASFAYAGGVLAPNGDIHFIPNGAPVGQKISSSGVVSTYSIITANYNGGVLDSGGNIHFIPVGASVGQKLNINGGVSSYTLVYTVNNAYAGGALSPNGDVHFVQSNAAVGQKISSAGLVSTYSLVYTTSYGFSGGILSPNGEIHFIPFGSSVGQKVSVLPAKPLNSAVCCSSFLNKY